MDLETFSRKNRERCESPQGFNHKLTDWSLSDWLTATVGELGEAANVVKKLNRVRDGVPGNKESEAQLRARLLQELADTFIYLDLLLQRVGAEPARVVRDVFNAKSDEVGCRIKL